MSKLDELTKQVLAQQEQREPIKLFGTEGFLGTRMTTPQAITEEPPLNRLTREALQAGPRAILSTALTIAPEKVRESIGEIKPEEEFGKIGKVLLGERPIKPIETEIAETELALKPKLGEAALPAAFAIGFGGTLLDLALPGGKASFLKQLAKTTDKNAVKGLLLKGVKDITESEADNLAVKLAPITDTKLIEKELGLFAQTKAELAEKALPKPKEVSTPILEAKAPPGAEKAAKEGVVAPELESIIQEANKKIGEIANFEQKIKDFHLGKWGDNLTEEQRVLKAKELNHLPD